MMVARPRRERGTGHLCVHLINCVRATRVGGSTSRRTDGPQDVVFPDEETEPLADTTTKAGQYYLHRFYKIRARPQHRQPRGARRDRQDHRVLDGAGPLRLPGGRRAVPAGEHRPDDVDALRDPHAVPRATCARFLSRRNGEGVLLGEVNLPLRPSSCEFFGDGGATSSRMLFDFIGDAGSCTCRSPAATPAPLVERADATGPRSPKDVRSGPRSSATTTSSTLDKLTEAERKEVFDAFGPDKRHAALRPRPAPSAAADARRRPAQDPTWSTACSSPCPAPRCCSAVGEPRRDPGEGAHDGVVALLGGPPGPVERRLCSRGPQRGVLRSTPTTA